MNNLTITLTVISTQVIDDPQQPYTSANCRFDGIQKDAPISTIIRIKTVNNTYNRGSESEGSNASVLAGCPPGMKILVIGKFWNERRFKANPNAQEFTTEAPWINASVIIPVHPDTNYNQFSFLGRMGEDPKVTYLESGKVVAKFSLAINASKIKSYWYQTEAWGKQTEPIIEYARKGSSLAVQGRLQLEQWAESSGELRQKIKVNMNSFDFAGGGKSTSSNPEAGSQPSGFENEFASLGTPGQPPAPYQEPVYA